MKTSTVTTMLVMAILGATSDSAAAEVHSVTRELQVTDFSTKLLDAVNSKRSEKGLDAVCINEKLMKAAQVLADDMAANNFIRTTGSDGSNLTERAEGQNMTISNSAELVAAGYNSVDSVVAAWLKSSESAVYSDLPFMGPGYKFDKNQQYMHYWVLDFADGDSEACM